jgi:TIR domain
VRSRTSPLTKIWKQIRTPIANVLSGRREVRGCAVRKTVTTMAKIFISYDRASKDVTEQLVQDLTDDGHEIWFDQHLTGGQKWWDNILSEIRQCEIFVAVLTLESLESRACQRELKYAGDLQRILLPIRLSDKVLPGSLPPALSELQWVDYSLRNIDALKSLQRTLRRLSEPPPLPDPLPAPPPVPISYRCQLIAKIDSDSQLPPQEQRLLVVELREHFRNGDPSKEIMDLLQRIKMRPDLLASVSQDIDDLQRELDSRRSGGSAIARQDTSILNIKSQEDAWRSRLFRAKCASTAALAVGALICVLHVAVRDTLDLVSAAALTAAGYVYGYRLIYTNTRTARLTFTILSWIMGYYMLLNLYSVLLKLNPNGWFFLAVDSIVASCVFYAVVQLRESNSS